jgi:two-component system response regulator FlrC
MTAVQIIGAGFAAAGALADLLARRRVPVTAGAASPGPVPAALVLAAPDAGAERRGVEAARAAGIRQVVLVQEGAADFAAAADLGGRLLRVALPAPSAPAAADPGLLMLADLVAAPLHPMVAAAPATGALVDLARRVARTDVTVFVNGPTGSGKEVLARLIHAASRRADRALVAINCAAIPDNMLEAMLFGHEKGAFTGAQAANRGLIRAAEGGTLMLDEISEMPLALQAKLLRVIQERRITPVGGAAEVAVDIRIIATANRDMTAEVRAGRFREDLFYRLNVFPLATRPLAARREDIPALATALLRRHAQGAPPLFSAEALRVLAAQDWPGNVRELENVVQRALVLCDGRRIGPGDILLDGGPPAAALPLAEAV